MVAYTDSVCVFCGSSPGKKPEYLQVADRVGKAIADHKWRLVYGGGSRGCMGGVSQATYQAGGSVLGVIPSVMVASKPKAHLGVPVSAEGSGPEMLDLGKGSGHLETVVVESMHQRKQLMTKESNLGFIGLPGGFGTLDEVMEMISLCQLGIHSKPMVLLNVNGFWTPTREQIDLAVEEGFIAAAGLELVRFVDCTSDNVDVAGELVVAEVIKMQEMLSKCAGGHWDWNKAPNSEGSALDAPAGNGSSAMEVDNVPAVEVSDLTFTFSPDLPSVLEKCNLILRRGSRCLLVGANGAGKSTLLRLLAGKRLCDSKVKVFGKDVFRENPKGITYLGTEWAMNPVVRSDIVVSHFLDSVGGYRHKERRDKLLDILDVNLDWHMHAISDGERRRVQLCMGLMEPWTLLLLDEVTVDLDVQVRADLLDFLQKETEERDATIIYATHIFDALQSFPTHVAHMRMGSTTTRDPIAWPPTEADAAALPPTSALDKHHDLSQLLSVSLAWLREDRVHRQEAEKRLGRKRGARRNQDITDSEKFFSKYDYSQTVIR